MGKSSSHYTAQFIAFIGHSSNNDRIHCVYIQDFFRCELGWEVAARAVANKACHKLVGDMHYEARLQAVVTYNVTFEFRKVTKKEARKETLTKEQYMKVNI